MWGSRGVAGVMVPALLPPLRTQQGFGAPSHEPWNPRVSSREQILGAVHHLPRTALAGTPGPGDARGSVWTRRLHVGDAARKDQGRSRPVFLRKKESEGLGSLRKWKSQAPGARRAGAALLRQASLTAAPETKHSSEAVLGGLATAASLSLGSSAPVLSPSGGLEGGPVRWEGL